MVIGSVAVDIGAAWLAKKAVEAVGVDLARVAGHVADDVTDVVRPMLPANIHIGRIINTKA